MSRHFFPPLKIFLLFFTLVCWSIIFGCSLAHAANPPQTPTTSLEELKLKPITTIEGKVGDILRKWYAEGTAAGNVGDYYDNRDRKHSHLKMEDYPQLQKIVYSKKDKNLRKDYAAQRVLLPHVVFGNSSTSAGRLNGGSNVRTYYTNSRGMAFLYAQYTHNNLYIYPTHRDYYPGIKGDVFPTNSPYLLAPKGHSGSDRKYMNAVAQTLAAFRPDVKRKLIDAGFLMPTIQMILRYTAAGSWQNYLTGNVHRVADIKVDNQKMIEIAHELQIDDIPPLVQLKVIEEDEPLNGEDFFAPGHSIKLADTPCVIARIFREKSYWHRMVVSAEASRDLDGRALSYYWKVLQGDPKRISIQPLNAAGSVVEIRIPFHERQSSADGKNFPSNRVEIGVFVKAGKYYSAPGFITSFSLDNEARTYDKQERILEIGYGMGTTAIEISDWNSFFRLFDPENISRTASFLREHFSRKEIEYINGIAEDYIEADAAIAATQKKLKDKEGAEKRELQKEFRKQQKAKGRLISRKQKKHKHSISELALRAINGFIEDPDFLDEYHSDIITFFNAASVVNKSAFTKELNRLSNYGIITKQHDFAIEITPIREGSATLVKRLTEFEYALVKNLNATTISSLIFPGIVKSSFEVNFVDQRLITPKFWRDVYHYNKTGLNTGWTRYSEDGKTEFNRDGLIVLEKDSLGRCIKGQKVEYRQDRPERDKKGRQDWANTNPVKQIPGNEIWHYKFADDSDWQGKVVKIEKI